MSTETIQTELVLEKGEFCFLPLADDVYYEFICVEKHLHGKEPFNLLAPWELKAGQEYLMVVSDCYGLIRYQTEDIFLCRKIVRGLPDLIFKRRAGLAYSFTGEKITGEQLLEVFHNLEGTNPYLNTNAAQLTLFPSLKDEKDLPGYKLVIAFSGKSPTALDENQITIDFEEALSSINKEFRDKRASGRLKQTEVIPFHYDQLAMLLGNHSDKENGLTSRAWESQFKLMPLNQTLWETVIAKR